jgi:von Willebrand factor
VLNDDGECVTISMCNCLYKGMEFKPGYKEVRPGRKYLELCTCQNARWSCVEAKTDDSTKYPAASDMTSKCSAVKNEVFTTCEPVEPLTCKNMHLNITSMTTVVGGVCRAGCKCKDGYVLDTILKQCVLPENCSCHHGGKSYSEGEKINEDCNTW